MGFRFRKSVKIAPGVRLNFGKKSTSVSLGGKGARFTINNKGKKTASFGIPGTGLYYTESIGGKKMKKRKSNTVSVQAEEIIPLKQSKPKKPLFKKWWFWAIAVWIVFCMVTGGVDTPEEETPQQTVQEEVAEQQEEKVESVVTEEPEEADPAPITEEETEVPEPVTEEVSEPPVEEPKVEPPAVVAPVVIPAPEEPVVETPPVVQPEPEPAPEPFEEMVWASRTGEKYHSDPTCSGMKKPIQMTRTEAEKTRKPCKNCY